MKTNSNPSTVEITLPTYRTKPEDNDKFYPSHVKKIIDTVLQQEFTNTTVDAKWIEDWSDGEYVNDVEDLSKAIADKIKARCRDELNLPRYKLVIQVTIGQRKDQGVRITSRCLWDTSTDQYASASFQNEFVWASALVFGLYTD